MNLRPWQRRFLASALADGIRTSVLSLPRGNGKSSLVAWLALRALTPGDPLFVAGHESHIAAASLGQARRTTFRLLREQIEALPNTRAYRIAESIGACHVIHNETNTRVSVIAASGKHAQGLVRAPWAFIDEPGSLEVVGGQLMHDAIQTAMGKPGCSLRAVYIGTIAPASRGWWPDMVRRGSHGSVHVTALEGRPDRWDQAPEIKRCNPLMWTFKESRKVLLEERDNARNDSRLKAAFLSFRLNVPTGDEASVLLSPPEWERVCGRPAAGAFGRPVVGVDLGGGRAWSAAVALWPSGRLEAAALAPGIPSIEGQEKRDRVPRGTYQGLVDAGVLRVAAGLHVPPVRDLVDLARRWRPAVVVCDRFRMPELLDAAGGLFRVIPRINQWGDATEDIRALRRLALDGPLSCTGPSRGLVGVSLVEAAVTHDDSGNVKLVKRGHNNQARDDVAAALVLAAGAHARAPRAGRPPRLHVVGAA